MSKSVTVSAAATVIVAGDLTDNPHGGGAQTGQVFLKNNGAQTVYVGPDASVTATGSSIGQPLVAGAVLEAQLPAGRAVYGITASGSAAVIATIL